MRKSKEATAESRRRILKEAARLYRAKGFDGVGVADIMAAAGMTHGGFYRHFRSKDALIAESMATAFEERMGGSAAAPALETVRRQIDNYLSEGHVANPDHGCPIAALGSETTHVGANVAASFREGIEKAMRPVLEALGDGSAEGRAKALRLFASLVGAVVIARAAGESRMRQEVLEAVKSDDLVARLLGAARRSPSADPAAASH